MSCGHHPPKFQPPESKTALILVATGINFPKPQLQLFQIYWELFCHYQINNPLFVIDFVSISLGVWCEPLCGPVGDPVAYWSLV